MAQRIDLPQQNPPLPFFDVSTHLDGVSYTLQFRWNTRAEAWFITILDEPGQNVLMGDVRVVADYPLFASTNAVRYPPGILIASDTSGQGLDPGLSELGGRVVLLYIPVAELGP